MLLTGQLTSSRILTVVPEPEGSTLLTQNCASLYNPTPLLSNSHCRLDLSEAITFKVVPQQNVEVWLSCFFSPSYMYFLP
jgi:uncharacterized membrane protein